MHGSLAYLRNHAPIWLFRLSVTAIVLLTLGLAYAEPLHSAMLELGESTWDEYFTLRSNYLSEPSCQPDQDREWTLEELAGDSERPTRSSCREEWERYRVIEQRRTPSLELFSTLERGLAEIRISVGNHRRALFALIGLVLVALSTLQRRYISLAPIRTQLDHQVQMGSMVLINGLLAYAAIAYQLGELEQAALSGSEPAPFNWLWTVAFGGLSVIGVFRLFRPPRDLPAGGAGVRAILALPVLGLLCLLLALYAKNAGHGQYYHGFSVLLAVFEEVSDGITRLVLGIWFYIWLAHQILGRRNPAASTGHSEDRDSYSGNTTPAPITAPGPEQATRSPSP